MQECSGFIEQLWTCGLARNPTEGDIDKMILFAVLLSIMGVYATAFTAYYQPTIRFRTKRRRIEIARILGHPATTMIGLTIICFMPWVALIDANIPLPFARASLFVLTFSIAAATHLTLLLISAAWLLNRLGKTWPKGLDFFYLGFASLGLLRLINTSVPDPAIGLDRYGVVFLSLALSIRLAKSIIEVFFDRTINAKFDVIDEDPLEAT